MITYSYINRLEQFGELDIDLILFDDSKEVLRCHKAFKKGYGKDVLEAEAQKEIDTYLNPPPPIEESRSEIDILRGQISDLEIQLIEKDQLIAQKDAEIAILKPVLVDEVIL